MTQYPHVEFITAETWDEAYDKSQPGTVILYQDKYGWWAFDSLDSIRRFRIGDHWKMFELKNLKRR